MKTVFLALCLVCLTASQALALPPGAPLPGTPGFSVTLRESPDVAGTQEGIFGPFQLPVPVVAGFLVLVESAALPATDPHNWSDVVDFQTHQTQRQAFLVSDPGEQGISDANLAPLGLSVAAVQGGNTTYVIEQPKTIYNASNGVGVAKYTVISDMTRPVLHPADVNWVTLGGSTVQFHLTFRNEDHEAVSEAVNGQMMSQPLGVFLPDYGSIGSFSVPELDPDSFFDVFVEIPLSQLPPSAQEIMPGALAVAAAPKRGVEAENTGCPPDDHWDGNVDISWTGASGGGQVNVHKATMLVCPGSGNSYIHLVTFCGSLASWSISGVCPGWTATLVNEGPPGVPDGPAPNPVPAGWTGFMCLTAVAGTPIGSTCAFSATFLCDGVPATVDFSATACQCGPLKPGAPLTGPTFTAKVKERPDLPPGQEPIFAVPLPVPVVEGYVVLLEQSGLPPTDPHGWSDVVVFRNQPAPRAILVSDSGEQGISDQDLAPLGITVNDVLTGLTEYVIEKPRTLYDAANGKVDAVAHYIIISDVSRPVLHPTDITWTTLPGTTTVQFHAVFRNEDPEAISEEATGQMMSQRFGVFMPDYGQIGTFTVPEMEPNSFFDVFVEVDLSQLPPSAQEILPGMLEVASTGKPGRASEMTGGCPPDDHWDGNVDINWQTPTGGGQVNKHFGTLHVCPGSGNSYIHTLVFCNSPLGATWSIAGVCPGWSVNLVNEGPPGVPDGPAPNPVPPNWTGYICVSAVAGTPIGSICAFTVTFFCDGAPGVIDMEAKACDCGPLKPGAPLNGPDFTVKLRERPDLSGAQEPIFSVPLPSAVVEGYVVLTEQPGLPPSDPHGWSDVVVFRNSVPPGPRAILVSDSGEQGFSDQDLAPLGITVNDVVTGNTVYVVEKPRTLYDASNSKVDATAHYIIISDVTLPVLHPSDVTWTTIAGPVEPLVQFHAVFRNEDPEAISEEAQGQMMSQRFGVFLPDYGQIGTFTVPELEPNSFFDVFVEIPLSQLPPSAQEIVPGMLAVASATKPGRAVEMNCPPDDHWDGNVDINWASPDGSGQVNKHFGTLHVCPGSGNSYIHVLVFCNSPLGAPWSIAGVCPGWSVNLVNEGPPGVPDGPAPNPVPPGWTGFICVSAVAGTPIGSTCAFTVTFDCDGVPGVIDMEAQACPCGPLGPGAPLAGQSFTLDIFEGPEQPGALEIFGPFAVPVVVEAGFVVLLEHGGVPVDDPHNWSDVVDFKSHQAGQQVFFISDSGEQGITDADMAPLGITVNDVLTGNTVYLVEQSQNPYDAPNPKLDAIAHYVITSDVEPGSVGQQGPAAFGIHAAIPNPTRGDTRFEIGLTRAGQVRLAIYDLSGKLVRTLIDGEAQAGRQTARWDGRDSRGTLASPGAYFIKLSAEGKSAVRRIAVVR